MAGRLVPDQIAPLFVAVGQQYGIPPQVLASVSEGGMPDREAIIDIAKALTQAGYHHNPVAALDHYSQGQVGPVISAAQRLAPDFHGVDGYIGMNHPGGRSGPAAMMAALTSGPPFPTSTPVSSPDRPTPNPVMMALNALRTLGST